MLDRLPKWLVDVLLTAFVVVTTAGDHFSNGRSKSVGVLAVAASAAVIVRRREPVGLLAFLSSVNLLLAFGHHPRAFTALAVAFYSVAECRPRPIALRAAAISLAVVALGFAIDHPDGIGPPLTAMLALAAVYAIGDNVHARRQRTAEEARRAVAEERARIARELHDMVTHNVSVMVVQAAAGNDVFDDRPDQARAALEAVEETGRRALGELRRLLDVVADEDGAQYDPQPGLDRIDTLVESVRAIGLGVDLTVEGTPRELPPAVELSAFRIVQEALTNTLRHARASRASVRVRYTPDALEVEVDDDGTGAVSTNGGRGIVGMRERVALFGGDLVAGARPGGGFAVRARMPVEAS